jgi:hypothetical protein
VEKRVHGPFLLKTTGERLLLTPQERMDTAESAVERVAGRVPILLHCGAADTVTPCRRAEPRRDSASRPRRRSALLLLPRPRALSNTTQKAGGGGRPRYRPLRVRERSARWLRGRRRDRCPPRLRGRGNPGERTQEIVRAMGDSARRGLRTSAHGDLPSPVRRGDAVPGRDQAPRPAAGLTRGGLRAPQPDVSP